MEDRAAPAFCDPGHVRWPVVHPGSDQDRPGRLGRPGVSVQLEAVAVPRARGHQSWPELDGAVRLEPGASALVELGRWPAVGADEAADGPGGEVARLPSVDDQRVSPSASEDQPGAEPGGSRADDDAIPGSVAGAHGPGR